ncbi:MAG: sialate O-acetylesterase [Verrucomicrobiota bacterium]
MKLKNPLLKQTALGLASLGILTHSAYADPAAEADVSKPVKVFILLGQSNMVGAGKVEGLDKPTTLEHFVKNEKQYPFLINADGTWSERKDVRNVRMMTGKLLNNDWMKVTGKTMGPEYGIGHKLGDAITEPVMILKSCIGNRGLGWDLLPPGSERFEFEDKGKTWVYAGYKDTLPKWEKGTEPVPVAWYAGKQYDDDTADAKKVLADLGTYYPGATKYEVAGFFFWQGEKDCGDAGHSAQYEKNLVNFIKALRKDFNSPNAKFVLGTLGEATKESTGNTGTVFAAHLAVDGEAGKYPDFKGNVATVITNPMAQGGSGNGHYGGNAKVYMDVGIAMGEAMAKLLK